MGVNVILQEAKEPVVQDIIDVDSHEMIPMHAWEEAFGPFMAKIGHHAKKTYAANGGNNDIVVPDHLEDSADIDELSVWESKGARAPGAWNFARREEVMSLQGVKRQLVFPSGPIMAMTITTGPAVDRFFSGELPHTEVVDLGVRAIREYNEWALRVGSQHESLVPVVYLPSSVTPRDLVEQTEDYIARGCRAVHVCVGQPLGGLSPADPDLDPFWALLSDHNVCCTAHVGSEYSFLSTYQWVKAPAFALGKVESSEIGLEPYSFATLHLAHSNWLVCMVLGGVFERHSNLRFGMIEVGSAWLGPLAEQLDMWALEGYRQRLSKFLSMPPSDYISRNVRVTPFNNLERPDQYIQRYPKLADSICYSTDFPHYEGGLHSAAKMHDLMAPLGDDVLQKFFHDNGAWLLPD